MRILHYFLGFPPHRSGGLTKMAYDLMKTQTENEDVVCALWPGIISFNRKRTIIREKKCIGKIKNFEIINPLPVSLDEGIIDFNSYMKPCDSEVFKSFLNELAPDVIHIHTLMGLHKEFIEVANDLGIRMIFTTHDYFGICPKVTLYRYGRVCNYDNECRDCINCNLSALSPIKIKMMQSTLYAILKNSFVVRAIRSHHRNKFFLNDIVPSIFFSKDEIYALGNKYNELRGYYIEMFLKIDMIHFNSSLTEKIYKKYFTPRDSRIVTITHTNINDNRKINKWTYSKKLRITSLIPAKPFKGYSVLINALDEMWKEGRKDFQLNLFCQVPEIKPYMKVREKGFLYKDLKSIFYETDVLVAPSIWYETFGFTVLEAISYGVPVIVSNHVGANDIVDDCGIIIEAGNVEDLKKTIYSLDKSKLTELHDNIQVNGRIKTWKNFINEMYNLYKIEELDNETH